MQVSKNQLLSYNISSECYFPTRVDRNNYYSTIGDPKAGTYCAVAENPNVDQTDMTSAIWNLEIFNGKNWTLASIDDSFALVVTNDGLKALTYAQEGGYKLIISRVKLRKEPITFSSDIVINFTDNYFCYNSKNQGANKSLVVLDTADELNTTFTMEHNISWRINTANAGVQYIIMLDTNTIGFDYANMTDPNDPVYLYSFNIGAAGLYALDENGEEILFAVANVPNSIYKYTTTASRAGNAVKLYLNTTLSNLGYVADLTVMPEDNGSLPEVVSDEHLATVWEAKTVPHNVYLVDNYAGTGVPALAVRTGDPVVTDDLQWTYFTPNSSAIKLNENTPVASNVKDYMAVYWNSSTGRYEKATGHSDTQGIKIGRSIVYNGQIVNTNHSYKYNITVTNTGDGEQHPYKVGDTFTYTVNGITFNMWVTEVTAQGRIIPSSFNYTPQVGDATVSATNVSPEPGPGVTGTGLRINISCESIGNTQSWSYFGNDWYNKPLYVSDTDPGLLTTTITETFIGWCTGVNPTPSIKLAIDLQTKATEEIYGVVRYATNDEVKKGNASSGVNTTVVTPEKLQANYVQKTLVSGEPGESPSNPVVIDSHTKFTKQIVSTVNDVAFKGTAYRALWADLAEMYKSDKVYLPGTLITIGAGEQEITIASIECNGIISTKPGYILGEKNDDKDLPVALVGKVPVIFSKDCNPQFGDRIYLSKTESGKASTIPNGKCLGKIIDKDENLRKKNTIMCSIRINF